MHIELFGCTSAGKSTLIASTLEASRQQTLNVCTGDDFVLRQVRLERLQSRLLRSLVIDCVALATYWVSSRRYRDFWRLARRHLRSHEAPPFERLNLWRNTLKKMGIFELVRRCKNDDEIVLVDEGTIHAAHNLFVHDADPPSGAVKPFLELVPLPEVAVYVVQRQTTMVERTLSRGHPRLADKPREDVERFVRIATATFDEVIRDETLKERLLVVDLADMHVLDSSSSRSARLMQAARLIENALERLDVAD